MSNPLRNLSNADRGILYFLVLDVAGSLLLGATQDSLAGLSPPEAIMGFALLFGALSVLLVEVVYLILEGESLSPPFLLLGAACLIMVTFGPFNSVSLRFYDTVVTWLSSKPARIATLSTPPGGGANNAVQMMPTNAELPVPSPLPTEAEGVQPTVLNAPACAMEPEGEFRTPWAKERLGCPVGPATRIWGAWQEFQNGALFWREDRDTIYTLYGTGTWLACPDDWMEGTPNSDPSLAPPAGCYQPTRGFGKVWRERSDVQAGLGWAVELEQGMCVTVQDFSSGAALLRYSQAEQGCLTPIGYNPPGLSLGIVLRPDGSWTPYH